MVARTPPSIFLEIVTYLTNEPQTPEDFVFEVDRARKELAHEIKREGYVFDGSYGIVVSPSMVSPPMNSVSGNQYEMALGDIYRDAGIEIYRDPLFWAFRHGKGKENQVVVLPNTSKYREIGDASKAILTAGRILNEANFVVTPSMFATLFPEKPNELIDFLDSLHSDDIRGCGKFRFASGVAYEDDPSRLSSIGFTPQYFESLHKRQG